MKCILIQRFSSSDGAWIHIVIYEFLYNSIVSVHILRETHNPISFEVIDKNLYGHYGN